MGGNKSKPRELGQHSRSLDGTVSINSGGGGTAGHHLSSCQQNFTPNRTPVVDGSRHGAQNISNNSDLFGGVESMNNLTSPLRSALTAGTSLVFTGMVIMYLVTVHLGTPVKDCRFKCVLGKTAFREDALQRRVKLDSLIEVTLIM